MKINQVKYVVELHDISISQMFELESRSKEKAIGEAAAVARHWPGHEDADVSWEIYSYRSYMGKGTSEPVFRSRPSNPALQLINGRL